MTATFQELLQLLEGLGEKVWWCATHQASGEVAVDGPRPSDCVLSVYAGRLESCQITERLLIPIPDLVGK